uniref:Reverse transcriptase domain-containing protein n=1 Tax=Mycena chlorophos TaxID=658473 RepID=A0ABQ0L1M2_MYCCL|nr:predicted protein [Mycena chlorophos]
MGQINQGRQTLRYDLRDPEAKRQSGKRAGIRKPPKTDGRALQQDANPPNEEEREQILQRLLENIETELNPEQQEMMCTPMTEEEITEGLRLSQRNRSAGTDGLIYEFWKTLESRYQEDTRCDRPGFNIIEMWRRVFRDVAEFGAAEGTDFLVGWMCPIYKKGDRTEISNYRPITLLNTDHKIMTKVMAMRWAKVAATLIHKDQAGFIPGGKISSQTMLIRMVMEYAETTEQNGIIVALDQEKAYDRIKHDYLWF